MLTMTSGGNDPAIICDDVDIEKVAPQVMIQAYGVICMTLTRGFRLLLMHSSTLDKFVGNTLTRSADS